MKLIVKKGSTSVTTYVFIQDSASTTGNGKTGIAYNTASLTAYYVRPLGSATSITLATQTVTGAWSSGGFVEVDATNMPGWYRFDIPDACLATGVNSVGVHFKGASGMAPLPLEIQLVAYDPQDSVRMGMTALPNATAGANGGLPTGNASGQVTVGAMANDTLTAAALATDAVTEIQSGLSTLTAAGVRTAIGLASANLDTQLTAIDDYIDTEVAAIKAKTDNLPSDPADASDIAASFSTVNSTLATIAGYIDTEVAAIKAKTDNLPSDPADASDIAASFSTVNSTLSTIAGYIDTEVAAIKAKTDNLPSDPADASDIAASFSTVNSTLATIAGYIDTEVAAIKAKTDNLPSDPADASDIADSFTSIASTLSTIATYIDTEVAAIKAKTDNLPSDPADASDIADSFSTVNTTLSTIAGYLDTEVAAIKAKTDNLPASPAATSDIPTASENADALLGRNLAGGSDGGRTVQDALRFLRNKVVIADGTVSVYAEDDSTVIWSGTVTTDATANPITAVDPA